MSIGVKLGGLAALAALVCGCGSQAGYVVNPPMVKPVAAIGKTPTQGGITLTAGPNTVVTYNGVRLVIPPSDLTGRPTVAVRILWVPIVRVPTIAGARLALRGTATILVPAVWAGGPASHWQAWPITVTLPLAQPIPGRTTSGGQMSLAMKVQAVIIYGRSATGQRETLVVARPLAGQERWQDIRSNRDPASRRRLSEQRVGVWLPYSPRAGGAIGYHLQSSTYRSLAGLSFRVQTRYNLLIHSAGPGNLIFYDRGTQGDRWYVQRFASLSWLPGAHGL